MYDLETLLDTIRRAASHGMRFAAPVGAAIVTATSAAVLKWPSSYLAPGLAVGTRTPGEADEWSVIVSCDIAHHKRMSTLLDGLPSVEAETYESHPAARFDIGSSVVLRYPGDGGMTVVDRERRRVTYVDHDLDRCRFESARLVREVIRRLGEESGEAILHAGSVVLDGRAWIICGAKGAGKTTSVCALMEYAGATFIANDRVHVRHASGYQVRAWPMSTRIGVGTCVASAALRPLLEGGNRFVYPQTGWDPVAGLSPEDEARYAAQGGGPKIELVTQELCRVLDAPATGVAPLGGVLLPERGVNPVGITDADHVTARRTLLGQTFTPDDDAYPDWLGLRRTSRTELAEGADLLIDRMLRDTQVLRATFTDGRELVELLARDGVS